MSLIRYFLLLALALPCSTSWAVEEENNVDPWEPMNRRIFTFNEGLDKYLLLPVAKGYRFVTPDPVERGVSNFISNVYEVNTFVNSVLQGRPLDAVHSLGRFVFNTTAGFLGFIDIATEMGIERKPADFGQTMAVWGAPSGPYVMLPFWGPRTVRSGVGFFVDSYQSLPTFADNAWPYAFWMVEAIDIRANLIKADELVTGDRYIFIRNAYIQRREYLISGGKVDDSFSAPIDELDYEEF